MVDVSVIDDGFAVNEDEGVLRLCLQVSHAVRTRAVVMIGTSSGSALGMNL